MRTQDIGRPDDRPDLLPKVRSKQINPRLRERLLVKVIHPPDATSSRTPVGKRIGI